MIKKRLKALNSCKRPEEVYGELKEGSVTERLDELKHLYRSLVKIYHTDIQRNDNDKVTATEILKILNIFYGEAKSKITNNTYGIYDSNGFGEKPEAIITTKNHEYRVFLNISESEYTNIFTAEYDGDKGVEKVIIKIADEKPSLLKNEINILTPLNHFMLPTIIETFKYDDGSPAIVYKYEEAFNLLEVREKYKYGIKQYHVCWIIHRLLDVVGYLQTKSISNNNLQPSNILVTPSNHKVTITDFKYAINFKRGSKHNCVHEFSPPEVRDNFKGPHPGVDIYSIGKLGLFLLGGKEKPYSYPMGIHSKIIDFVELLMKYDPDLRPYDSWKLWHELESIRTSVFGKHKFNEFVM